MDAATLTVSTVADDGLSVASTQRLSEAGSEEEQESEDPENSCSTVARRDQDTPAYVHHVLWSGERRRQDQAS